MSVSCKCRALSGGGLCDGPVPRPKKSYRMWRVCLCVCVCVCVCVWVGVFVCVFV